MVQMKVALKLVDMLLTVLHFISHMVQMKECSKIEVTLISDSFISHMVQMKDVTKVLYDAFADILYIPHGSDERNACYRDILCRISLYPTWFR